MQPEDLHTTAQWVVCAYYADDVRPPKQPGALAFEVLVACDWMKDMEVEVAESRPDIGRVVAARRRSHAA